MRRPGLLGSIWPDDDDELLLRAALLPSEEAAEAWRRLRPRFVYADTTKEQQRLLPLVSRNLSAVGVDDPDLGRMKGLYRLAWYQNQFRLKELPTVAGLLGEAGIAVLALKGIPLAVRFYSDLGVRPMGDIDVLVPTARRDAALALLEADGWAPRPGDLRKTLDHRHGVGLHHPERGAVDLHWQVAMALVLRGDEAGSCDDFWAAAVPLGLEGTDVLAPVPADLLLNVLAHGCHWKSGAHLHWIADAVTLIREAGGDLDWARLVDQAEKRRVVLTVGDGLRYVASTLDAPVPPEVRERLDRSPVSRRDRIVHRARTERPRTRRLVGDLPATVAMHVHLTAHQPVRQVVLGYPAHLLRSRASRFSRAISGT